MEGVFFNQTITNVHVYKDLQIFLEDDIVVVRPQKDVILEVRDIFEIKRIAKELTNEQQSLILTDARNVYLGISRRARKFVAASQGRADVRIAEAYIVNTLPTKILANHYVNKDRQLDSVRVFDSKSRAKKWLRQFIEN